MQAPCMLVLAQRAGNLEVHRQKKGLCRQRRRWELRDASITWWYHTAWTAPMSHGHTCRSRSSRRAHCVRT